MNETLRLHDLAVQRGGLPVLTGLDFEVAAGDVLVLRGPNGIGKTTLLRTIAGLQPALSGRIEGAEDRVAYAAHADAVKTTLTVRENLEFWAGVYGTDMVDAALSRFNLNDLSGRAGQSLSAGQKRRLGLARLAVSARPIWCLDEPTVSLDAAAVDMFADAIRAHIAAGGSALIATHVDLRLEARSLDLSPYKAQSTTKGAFDEAFL